MAERLDGKVALITGASRGIGRAIAQRLAAEGAIVYAGARDAAKLGEAVGEIVAAGGKAFPIALDVADRASVDAALKAVLEAQGRIDCLVNNAGITRDNLMLRMKAEEWDQVLATNLTGTFLCTQAALKPMIRQRSGRIICISSVVGQSGNAGQANYAASKAGLIGFAKSIAHEVASRNITVNVVAPGLIDTDMTRAITGSAQEDWVSRIPLKRLGTPADMAGAALFLASPLASYIIGQTIVVDGGLIL